MVGVGGWGLLRSREKKGTRGQCPRLRPGARKDVHSSHQVVSEDRGPFRRTAAGSGVRGLIPNPAVSNRRPMTRPDPGVSRVREETATKESQTQRRLRAPVCQSVPPTSRFTPLTTSECSNKERVQTQTDSHERHAERLELVVKLPYFMLEYGTRYWRIAATG